MIKGLMTPEPVKDCKPVAKIEARIMPPKTPTNLSFGRPSPENSALSNDAALSMTNGPAANTKKISHGKVEGENRRDPSISWTRIALQTLEQSPTKASPNA